MQKTTDDKLNLVAIEDGILFTLSSTKDIGLILGDEKLIKEL